MWKYLLAALLASGAAFADDLAGFTREDRADEKIQAIPVENPGFEKEAAGWNLKPGFTLAPGMGRSATAALRYERTNPAHYQLATTGRLKVKPGAFYRFGVWVKTDNVRVSPDGGGATIAMEFNDGSGKYLTGHYLKGVTGTGDWTLVSDVVRIPKNATGAILSLYLWKGALGTVWFDDVILEEQGSNLWSLYSLNPYNTADDGKFTLTANYDGKSVSGKSLTIRMKQGDRVRRAELRNDRAEFPIADLSPGTHEAEFMILDTAAKKVLYSTAIPVRIAAEKPIVRLDRFGRTLVNGIPFLPLGVFTAGLDEKTMDALREAGLNTALPYSSLSLRLPEVFDLAEAKGLKIIFSCKDVGSTARFGRQEWRGVSGAEAIIEKITGLLKNHPALLAWYVNDEQPTSQLERLTGVRRLFNRLDPDHPTYGVLYQYESLPMYGPTSDILGVDPYPLNGDHLKLAVYAMRQARLAGLPIWAVPQLSSAEVFSGSQPIPRPKNPSEEKLRTLPLLEAAYGAKGFIFYKFEDLQSWRLPKGNFETEWAKLKNVVAMLKTLEPYILSETPSELLHEGEAVAARLRKADGKSVVILCSIGPGPATIRLKLEGSYRSQYGRTVKEGSEWLFRGEGINSDLLIEE